MATEPLRPGWEIPGPPQPESRFIDADDRCPHPERWTSTDGDSTECEVGVMIAGLVTGLQPSLVVETGAAFGITTVAIAGALKRMERGRLIALETDPDRAAEARQRLAEFNGYAQIVEESSLTWKPPGKIDLLFSDSFYETRVPEFWHLRPWMRTGTIIVFHDTAPGRGTHRLDGFSLRQKINALADIHAFNVIHLPTPRGISIAEVI